MPYTRWTVDGSPIGDGIFDRRAQGQTPRLVEPLRAFSLWPASQIQ